MNFRLYITGCFLFLLCSGQAQEAWVLGSEIKSLDIAGKEGMIVTTSAMDTMFFDWTGFHESHRAHTSHLRTGRGYHHSLPLPEYDSSCIYVEEESGRTRYCPGLEITSLVNYHGRIILSTRGKGMWIFEGGRFRQFYTPGVRWPEGIREMSLSGEYLWLLTDQGGLFVYVMDKQLLKAVDTGVQQMVADPWNVLWYTMGATLKKFADYRNDRLPEVTIRGVWYATGSGEEVIVRMQGFYSPDPGALMYYYRVGDDGPWVSNGRKEQVELNIEGGGITEMSIRASADGRYFSEIETVQIRPGRTEPAILWITAFGLLISLIAIAVLSQARLAKVNRSLRLRNERMSHVLEIAQREQKIDRLKLNPHFVYNVLNSINGLISLGQKEEARDAVKDFAGIMRTVMETAAESFVSLDRELQFLERYVKLERMCRAKPFEFVIYNEAEENLMIPPMMIQPLIENAIIHGLSGSDKEGLIQLFIKREEPFIVATVRDNGSGRTDSGVSAKQDHKSAATDLIRARLHMAAPWAAEELLVYRDLKDAGGKRTGTEVIIKLIYK